MNKKMAVKVYLEYILNTNSAISIQNLVYNNTDTLRRMGLSDRDMSQLRGDIRAKYNSWRKYVSNDQVEHSRTCVPGEEILDDIDIDMINRLSREGVIRASSGNVVIVNNGGEEVVALKTDGTVCQPIAMEIIKRYEFASQFQTIDDDLTDMKSAINCTDPNIRVWVYLVRTDTKIELRQESTSRSY